MSKLADLGMPENTIDAITEDLQLTVLPFDAIQARESARLHPLTQALGFSLGDRCCLAVAKQFEAPALTTDKAWARLDDAVGVTVELLR